MPSRIARSGHDQLWPLQNLCERAQHVASGLREVTPAGAVVDPLQPRDAANADAVVLVGVIRLDTTEHGAREGTVQRTQLALTLVDAVQQIATVVGLGETSGPRSLNRGSGQR